MSSKTEEKYEGNVVEASKQQFFEEFFNLHEHTFVFNDKKLPSSLN